MSIAVGEIYEGVITGITKFGAFVKIDEKTTGLVHISEVADTYVKEISDFLQVMARLGFPLKKPCRRLNHSPKRRNLVMTVLKISWPNL